MNTFDRKKWILTLCVLILMLALFAANAGRALVVNARERSDLIVVLAGETDRRLAYALRLLDHGYARRVMIDVPADAVIYGTTEMQLAREYVQRLPQASSIGFCPIEGLSTKDESHDVMQCLTQEKAGRILIVTSDFHTRRSLSIFRHEIPGRTWSIAAAPDDRQFGSPWWAHRQWAKTLVDEWLRLTWWTLVERWR